jgi:uncharacterized protein YecE (DUF72 family)
MNQTPAQIHIGTSGWSYEHWKGSFYPKDLKSADWLEHYAQHFSTVEINNTFYRIPSTTTVQNWYTRVPQQFLFAVKASRYITHQRKLQDCRHTLSFFYESIAEFKDKAGPILFQLPPFFRKDKDRLRDFIHLLTDTYSYTFEFRHASWYTDEIYEILSEKNVALCITDLHGQLSPEIATANFTYIRLHGPQNTYRGSYGLAKLKPWKKKIEQWVNSKTSVYCYFDNDEKGYAPKDALLLQKLLK